MLFICSFCNNQFERSKRNSCSAIKRGHKPYCSRKCSANAQKTKKLVCCKNCNKDFYKLPTYINRTNGNNFCSKSCSGIYASKNKKHGNVRSKLEKYIESKLSSCYPDLCILYNNKEAIKSELDIYIPSLNLAFELNGIFHYEPIFGSEKLTSVQNNDNRKFQACLEHGIELCIIDTSSQKYFKESTSEKFLKIIYNIINQKSGRTENRTLDPF